MEPDLPEQDEDDVPDVQPPPEDEDDVSDVQPQTDD